MITMRIFNTNGSAMELAACESGQVHIEDVYEPDRLNAATASMNFKDIPVKHVYIGTELACNKTPVDVEYVNVARKSYNSADGSVPIVDKNTAGKTDGNGVLVMKNAFRQISLHEPEMFIVEGGLKIHPVAMEAFASIPGYYIRMVSVNSSISCGMAQKGVKTFLIGTKKPFAMSEYEYKPVKLSDILERGVDYDELPVYAQNRLNRTVNSHPCVILDPLTDSIAPRITSHLAKDDSEILIQDGKVLRPLTLREISRLQGYDDSFGFAGSRRQAIRQIGDSIGVGAARWLVKSAVLHYFNDCYSSHALYA